MVCHETYKDSEGNWLSPEEIKISVASSGNKVAKCLKNGSSVKVGPSVKMSKSKKNVRPNRYYRSIWSRHRKVVCNV